MRINIKGHIGNSKGNALCGSTMDAPFKPLSLYGELCPRCAEVANMLLKGDIKSEDLIHSQSFNI